MTENPSRLEKLFEAGIPDRDLFVRSMLAEFPGVRTAEGWAAEWQKGKDIEAARGKPNR